MRMHITPYQRRQIAFDQEYRCAGPCGRLLPPHFHLDHRQPLFLGEELDVLSNIQALCGNCHTEKTAYENAFRGAIRRAHQKGEALCPWCSHCGPANQPHQCTPKQDNRDLNENFAAFIQRFRYRPSASQQRSQSHRESPTPG